MTTVDRKGRSLIPASVRKRYSLAEGQIRLSVFGYIFEKKMDFKGRVIIPKKIRQSAAEDNLIMIDFIEKSRRR
ncbi:MAG: hypothetical protein U9O53_02490 [archaeon]|nr:hypothetical protein [archaeon]